jgi:hypothetical protein
MTQIQDAIQNLVTARSNLRDFNSSLSLEQVVQIVKGDETTVEVLALKNTQSMLLDDVMKAEEEYKNAQQEAKAH